jgi:[acyl-carrier-protein] S-malonyltransferase
LACAGRPDRQVDGPVRWVESVRFLREALGVERVVEVGPGSVLTGLVRRIVPELEAISLAEPEALSKLIGAPPGGESS